MYIVIYRVALARNLRWDLVVFKSSCRVPLHTVPFIAESQEEKLRISVFIVFGLTRPGIKSVLAARPSVTDPATARVKVMKIR